MTNDKGKVRSTVEIYGEKYTVVGSEDPEHIHKVAMLVDKKMREIKENNQSLDTRRLAVLTALNTINELLKCQKELDELKKENKIEE